MPGRGWDWDLGFRGTVSAAPTPQLHPSYSAQGPVEEVGAEGGSPNPVPKPCPNPFSSLFSPSRPARGSPKPHFEHIWCFHIKKK